MSQTDTLNNFTVGEIEVSPQHNMLRNSAREISVQPKVMAVLYYLAQNQSRVVSNDELLQSVWSGRVVTLASVQKSINALRTALADLAGEQEFVTYFSKRGYQLIQPVVWRAAETAIEAEEVAVRPTQPDIPLSPIISEATPTTQPQTPQQQLTEIVSTDQTQRNSLWAAGVVVCLIIIAVLLSMRSAPPQEAAITSVTPTPMLGSPAPHEAISSAPVWQALSPFLPSSPGAHHATPHPDGKRAAYLIDNKIEGDNQSDLMIKDNTGLDWLLARSTSTWVDLAWSPSGRALAALEIFRADGLLSGPDFYQNPQYLYNFHLFTLDLKGQHLLEKNLLSQWQGKVNSITWWDENTLEFVASMGANINKERYRYSITDQTLTALGPSTSATSPLVSRIHNKITALLSSSQDNNQIEFLDDQQRLLASKSISSTIRDIAWMPNAPAVVALDQYQNKIWYVPQQGTPSASILPAEISNVATFTLSNLKVGAANNSLFITATENTGSLFQQSGQTPIKIVDSEHIVANSANYSPDGKALIYASQSNNRAHIWRQVQSGNSAQAELLFEVEGTLQSMIWPSPDLLVVKINNTVASLQLSTKQLSIFLKGAQDLEPLALDPETQTVLAIKSQNAVRNIWRIATDGRHSKQLTFGEVGSARNLNNVIYFQYANQSGLWKLNAQEPNHASINDRLPQHSQILGIEGENVYFVTGGICHESSIQQLNLGNSSISTKMQRQDNNLMSFAFLSNWGALQAHCAPMRYTSFEIHQKQN